jgi:alpha-1,3-mannosyltransferase
VRVLSITPTFAPQVGGIESVVKELATHVRPLGVEMDVAHVATVHRELRRDRVEALIVWRVPLRGTRLVGAAPSLWKLAKDYDLLHVHDPHLLALTANVRWGCANVPAVVSTHGGFRHTRSHALVKQLYERTFLRLALGHYRRVLASSVADLDYFGRYCDRVFLCNNGVDISKFARVGMWENKSVRRWIYWGRLSHNKRIDKVIDCVAMARDMGYPIDLLIVGSDFDGLLDVLRSKVSELNLPTAVKFAPYLDDESLVRELKTRGIFVTASTHEGFGLSVVEAMAAGLIVVCRDMVPLNTFVKSQESGFFLRFDGEEFDKKAVALILQLSDVAARDISIRACHSVQSYNWQAAAEEFVAHYESVLQISS